MFVIHIYKVGFQCKEEFAVSEEQAKAIAYREFARSNVYKVKVWKGKIVRNVQRHANLILHLV